MHAARVAFPNTRVGSGALTYFAELNRCRPDLGNCDFVSHGSSAIIHAADDRSVVQSLEGLADTFASGRAIAGRAGYHAGLVAIGLRTNPYGADVAANPHGRRVAAAGYDPRQRALFGAAWAVGALAATIGHDVDSLALASPIGRFGILQREEDAVGLVWSGQVYPLFHVLSFFGQLGGKSRLAVSGLCPELAAVAAKVGDRAGFAIANLSNATCGVRLADGDRVWRLNSQSFVASVRDPLWLERNPETVRRVVMEPCEVVFVERASPTS